MNVVFLALKKVKNTLRLSLTQDFCIMAIKKSFMKSMNLMNNADKNCSCHNAKITIYLLVLAFPRLHEGIAVPMLYIIAFRTKCFFSLFKNLKVAYFLLLIFP